MCWSGFPTTRTAASKNCSRTDGRSPPPDPTQLSVVASTASRHGGRQDAHVGLAALHHALAQRARTQQLELAQRVADALDAFARTLHAALGGDGHALSDLDL